MEFFMVDKESEISFKDPDGVFLILTNWDDMFQYST